MSTRDDRRATAHASAARAFVERVRERDIDGLDTLLQFGSTVRGEASGLGSDGDFLAIVDDDADRDAVETILSDTAYDVMLQHGPVVEVHVRSRSTVERQRDHPFFSRAFREGTIHV
ncbi:MAG: nucleotidyltransferase domain-containing protein, partial [Halococcoides sp.]